MKDKPNPQQFVEFDDDDSDLAQALEKRATAASRSTWVSIFVNFFLTIVQIVVGVHARSQALVADGIHSLSDLVADFVVLFANRYSRQEADADHPYGHQRFETAASLVLGLLLLLVGIGMLWSAISKLESPQTIPQVSITALWVAISTLFCKEGLFRYMLSVAKRVKSSMLVANAWHARSDAASSLVVALGIFGNLQGYPLLDPLAALLVGFMISRTGWTFSWDALRDLMDRAVDEQKTKAIHNTIFHTEGVLGAHDLRTRKMGDMVVVDVHIEVAPQLNVVAAHDIAVRVRRRLIDEHQVLNVLVHVDPAGRPDLDN